VPNAVDPLGGAWAIEALTDELEARIAATLARLRRDGGMLKLIDEDVPQREIQERAYRDQVDVESGRRKIVGVNALRLEAPDRPAKRLKVDPRMEADQVRRLRAFRRARSAKAAAAATARLGRAARAPKENMFPFILAAVEARATLGEIFGALRDVFGEHHAR
jgi:methylmalonyl-CoA mutase N-terminal domain/subunit